MATSLAVLGQPAGLGQLLETEALAIADRDAAAPWLPLFLAQDEDKVEASSYRQHRPPPAVERALLVLFAKHVFPQHTVRSRFLGYCIKQLAMAVSPLVFDVAVRASNLVALRVLLHCDCPLHVDTVRWAARPATNGGDHWLTTVLFAPVARKVHLRRGRAAKSKKKTQQAIVTRPLAQGRRHATVAQLAPWVLDELLTEYLAAVDDQRQHVPASTERAGVLQLRLAAIIGDAGVVPTYWFFARLVAHPTWPVGRPLALVRWAWDERHIPIEYVHNLLLLAATCGQLDNVKLFLEHWVVAGLFWSLSGPLDLEAQWAPNVRVYLDNVQGWQQQQRRPSIDQFGRLRELHESAARLVPPTLALSPHICSRQAETRAEGWPRPVGSPRTCRQTLV